MKKFLSISLILLIAFNAGGYFFVFYQLEHHFKQIAYNRINEYIPLNNLEKIVIDGKSDSRNFKLLNEKEIRYYGKMYDIYKIEYENGNTVLYCVSDENEDIIHNAFAEYLNEHNDGINDNAVTNILKILITLAIIPNQNNINAKLSYKSLSIFYDSSLQKINIDKPYPPPRILS